MKKLVELNKEQHIHAVKVAIDFIKDHPFEYDRFASIRYNEQGIDDAHQYVTDDLEEIIYKYNVK